MSLLRSSLSTFRVLPSTSSARACAIVSSSSPAFSTSVRRQADPAENRKNSEGTMPGSGSTEEIADSEGAFSASETRPDEAGKSISREKPGVEMDSSAASNDNADRTASEGNKETTKSANGTNPPPSKENLGASKARKEQK